MPYKHTPGPDTEAAQISYHIIMSTSSAFHELNNNPFPGAVVHKRDSRSESIIYIAKTAVSLLLYYRFP